MPNATVRKLVHLTSQSPLANSEANPSHNSVGYGMLTSEDGHDIFFASDTVTGCQFEQLREGQQVYFEIDADYSNRAQQVSLVHDDAASGHIGQVIPPPDGYQEQQAASSSSGLPEADPMNQPMHSLPAALAELEQQLETPVVPGEMEPWLQGVREALTAVTATFRQVIYNDHPREFQLIAGEDLENQRRMEQLQAADQQLVKNMEELQQTLDRLQPAVRQIEPHEMKADDAIEQFTALGLAVVIAIRKQQRAIETWLFESLQRDRGVVD